MPNMPNDENPYSSPRAEESPSFAATTDRNVGEFAPCPLCSSTTAKKITYTWWGGAIGPRMLNHVQCVECRYKYNGKTGRSNRRAIVIYNIVGFGVGVAIVVLFGLMR